MSAADSRTLARVRLFGPFSARVGGVEAGLKGFVPAAIVARLALAAGEAVASDALAADIWEQQPATALGTLRANVSRLRSTVLGSALTGGRGGYALAAQVDVVDFRQAAEVALATRERLDLERAEALWLGEPLEGIEAAFVAGEIAALRELRRRVIEVLVEQRLGGGEVSEAIAAITPIVAENPSNEASVRLLSIGLARGGRSAEALDAIDDFAARAATTSPLLDDLRTAIVRRDPAVIPTIAAGRARQHGVSLPLTRFVGRRRELELLERLRREARLVVVTGPGGIGKTRLVLESLGTAAIGIDREQWFVELASLETEDDLLEALSELTGAGAPTVEAIAGFLSAEATLLVLDNAEHLLAPVADLCTRLLAASPGLGIIVTSREPLHVAGERLLPIAELAADDDALILFTERAADVVPGFELDAVATEHVRAIIGRLDALPLALELAAARLDVMDLAALRECIESDELLTASTPGSGRHSSLQRTIEWSIRLLGDHEIALLAQLARFAGGVSLETILAVCRLENASVRDTTIALAQKSLVATDRVAGSVHYRLLESVKSFARDLPAGIDEEEWRLRHATLFADSADELESRLRGSESQAVHARFDLSRAELLAALGWAVRSGNRELALRLAASQSWHWFIRGAMAEGKRWIDLALAMPGERLPYSEARAIWGAVMLIYRSGDKVSGREYVRRGLDAALDAWDDNLLALFLAREAMWEAGVDSARSASLLEQLESMLDDIDPWVRSEVLSMRSQCAQEEGRPASAMRDLEEAITVAAGCGHRWAAADCAWRLAHVLISVRRYEDALAQLTFTLTQLGQIRDEMAVMLTIHAAALATTGLDRLDDAAVLFGATDAIAATYGFDRRATIDDYHASFRTRAQQGMTPKDWNRGYRAGRSTSACDADDLVRQLARSVSR